jgi:hypothetical protein
MRALTVLAAWLFLSTPLLSVEARFKRGDANLDGGFDLSDAVKTLGVLFLNDPSPGCDNAMDSNDDGRVDISDAIYSLASLFTGGPDPKPPYRACGTDPTAGPLGCSNYPLCTGCLAKADLDAAVESLVPAESCLPADAAQVAFLSFLVTVDPEDLAKPCGQPPAPGWPLEVKTLASTLDLAAGKLTVPVRGTIENLPVRVEDTTGLNDPITCRFQVVFNADVIIPLRLEAAPDGEKRLAGIDPVDIWNVQVSVVPSPGFICSVIAGQKDQFTDQIVSQLKEALNALLPGLEAKFVGSTFCQPE